MMIERHEPPQEDTMTTYKIIRDAVGQYFVVSEDGQYSQCWRYDYRAAKADLAERRACERKSA